MSVNVRFKFASHPINPLPFIGLGLVAVFIAFVMPHAIGALGALVYLCGARIALLCIRHPHLWSFSHPRLRAVSRWKAIGVLLGTCLFAGIITHADPALAQLFGDAETEATGIFGEYIDQSIIAFLFGLMRVVVWVASVGFVFFAVYQAQRGEQWQPLLQNAFIVIAAVVVVEGLGALFFGDGGGTNTEEI